MTPAVKIPSRPKKAKAAKVTKPTAPAKAASPEEPAKSEQAAKPATKSREAARQYPTYCCADVRAVCKLNSVTATAVLLAAVESAIQALLADGTTWRLRLRDAEEGGSTFLRVTLAEIKRCYPDTTKARRLQAKTNVEAIVSRAILFALMEHKTRKAAEKPKPRKDGKAARPAVTQFKGDGLVMAVKVTIASMALLDDAGREVAPPARKRRRVEEEEQEGTGEASMDSDGAEQDDDDEEAEEEEEEMEEDSGCE